MINIAIRSYAARNSSTLVLGFRKSRPRPTVIATATALLCC